MSNDLIKIALWKKIFQTTDEAINQNNIENLPALLKCNNLQYHSKKVKDGDVFVALKGQVVDGHDYILEVASKSSIIIANFRHQTTSSLVKNFKNKIILVEDTKRILAILSASFYSFPSKKMITVGITGTNGKTSVCAILRQIFSSLNFSCGVIGTNGIFINQDFYPSENTTPIAIELQKNLATMNQQNVDIVFIEVSSHALVEGRANYTDFDVVAFTNISSEHLDFHENLENYFSAKKKIFTLLEKSSKIDKFAICCTDSLDEAQQKEILNKISNLNLENFFFQKKKSQDFAANTQVKKDNKNSFYYQISSSQEFSNYQLMANNKTKNDNLYSYQTNLLGNHNGENLTTALLITKFLAEKKKIVTQEDILKSKTLGNSLKKIYIQGRLEKISHNIFIDYAHTPDALEKILKSVVSFSTGKVVALFGCGGDRDKKKRSQMGKIACQIADYCFITSDNPRTENPQKIIDDILLEIKNEKNYSVIVDRKLAIKKAVNFIQGEDILLILGKGHEDYQIIGREKINFNEKKIVQQFITNRR